MKTRVFLLAAVLFMATQRKTLFGSFFFTDSADNERYSQTIGKPGSTLVLSGSAIAATQLLEAPHPSPFKSVPNIFVADSGYHRILWSYINTDGTFMVKSYGSYGNGAEQFRFPSSIAVNSQGTVWVVDQGNHRIVKLKNEVSRMVWLKSIGEEGSGNGQFKNPTQIAMDRNGNVYVADSDNHRIQKLDSEGNFLFSIDSVGYGVGQLKNPQGVAVSIKDRLYVADSGNKRILKFDLDGRFFQVTRKDDTFNPPSDADFVTLSTDLEGNVYAMDTTHDAIYLFDEYLWGLGSTKGDPKNPFINLRSLAFDTYQDRSGTFWSYGYAFTLERNKVTFFEIGGEIVNAFVRSSKNKIKNNYSRKDILFRLTNASKTTVRILDKEGHLVRTLIDNQIRPSGHNYTEWDGTGNDNNPVLSGDYNAEIIAQDFYKRRMDVKVVPIHLYTSPVLNILSSNPRMMKSGEIFKINYELKNDGAYVTAKLKYGPSGSELKLIDRKWHEPGVYTVSWDGRKEDGSNVPDGNYWIPILLYDREGNEGPEEGRSIIVKNMESANVKLLVRPDNNESVDFVSCWSKDGSELFFTKLSWRDG